MTFVLYFEHKISKIVCGKKNRQRMNVEKIVAIMTTSLIHSLNLFFHIFYKLKRSLNEHILSLIDAKINYSQYKEFDRQFEENYNK